MKNYGDITKISGCDVPIVNVIIGGSPCQDLSIAGKRSGLSGERSGLFMEQIRIIKEMREKDARAGRTDKLIRPRFMVWENVPGAFSSNKGADFGAVLTETVRIAEPKAPAVPMPKGGWPTAGCLTGDGVGGKWSVAWRVFDAQFWGVPQRRRRIALVADFGGQTAPEILFERESVYGYPPSRGSAWQTTPPPVKGGIGESINNRGTFYGDKTETLRTVLYAKTTRPHSKDEAPTICETDLSPTLNTFDIGEVRTNMFVLENHPQDSRIKIADDNVVQTLSGQMGTGGNNTPMVLAVDRAAYNQGINAKFDIGIDENSPAYTVVAKGPGAVCIGNGQADQLKMSKVCGTLDCMHDQKAVITFPLGVVRRLTPLECERLQGYPDGWTDIGEWIDSKGRKRESKDTLRYKALGNSIALPPWTYVLRKLSVHCDGDYTMASLFDGIGGFPLIWERLHGKGHCLWVSEIDNFPSAVTKRRFEEE